MEAGVGAIRVAWFHPEWTFDEMDADDAMNFERRSPYPCATILRAARLVALSHCIRSETPLLTSPSHLWLKVVTKPERQAAQDGPHFEDQKESQEVV